MARQVMSTYHTQPVGRVLQNLHTQPSGLTEEEAAARLADNGPNRIPKQTAKPSANPAVIVTLLASVFAFVLHAPVLGSVLIVLALAAAATHRGIGLGQHLPPLPDIDTHVLRGGNVRPIRSTSLVVGDIVQLTRGNTVPADLRIIDGKDILVNDALFSGAQAPEERFSRTVPAKTSVLYAHNMALAGSKVTDGTLTGVVVHTGVDTVLAAGIKALAAAGPTPTAQQLKRNYRLLGIAAASIYAVVLLFALFSGISPDATLFVLILFSVALVPSGLPFARYGIAVIGKRLTRKAGNAFTSPADVIQRNWQAVSQSTWAATRLAFILSLSLLILTGLSLWAARYYDFPLAVTIPQLLLISLLAAIPLIGLAFSRAKPMPTSSAGTARTMAIFDALLIAGFASAAYLLFFTRYTVDPAIIPTGTPIYYQAITAVFIATLLLFIANVIAARNPKDGYISRTQLSGSAFWLCIVATLSIAALICYAPFIAQPLGLAAPALADVGWAFILALAFAAIKQFFIYDQKHHRAHIHALHTKKARL